MNMNEMKRLNSNVKHEKIDLADGEYVYLPLTQGVQVNVEELQRCARPNDRIVVDHVFFILL
jgi:hypothetical protein